MSAAPQTSINHEYNRLPGRAKRLFGLFVNEKQRLYLGGDHLLVATNSYNYERYKRFYLADIQSLTIQKTGAGAVLSFILGIIAGLFATFAAAGYANQWDPVAQVVVLIIGGMFLGLLLINTAFGPTCQCHILTAVHEEPLYCLGRLYTAERVVEYLRAVIEGVQGTAGEMSAAAAQRVDRAANLREAAAMVRKDSGRLHLALFVMLLFDAILGAVVIFYRDAIPPSVSLVSTGTVLALVLASAIRQQGSDVPRSVRTPIWVALVFNVIMLTVMLYVAIVVQALQQSPDAAAAEVVQSGFITVGNAINFIVNSAVGAFGLYNLRVWRRAAAVQAEQQRVAGGESGQA
ncbi:MAG: hypothetical protein HUU46_02975 [Candidatus Hydrogenedentes bacterium]|nr:hypothetical protein [Candidatus Hydrogenedentota bacterium]